MTTKTITRMTSGWPMLAVGGVLSLFALHATGDLAPAAWLYGIALIRFCRTVRVRRAVLGVAAVTALDAAYWMYQADLAASPVVLLALAFVPPLTAPFVADRLLARRLPPLAGTLVYPATKVACEFLVASVTPLGTLFGVLGTTQHANLPLLQLASVTGVYGISFVVAWAAPVANVLLERRGPRPVVAYSAVLAVVLGAGAMRLAYAPVDGPTVRVAGVTASRDSVARLGDRIRRYDSVSEMLAEDPATMRSAFEPVNADLLAATAREARAGARIVVWPESGALAVEDGAGPLLDRVRRVAARNRVYVQVGLTTYFAAAPQVRNQTVLITPSGGTAWTYDKSHPVPVLEPYRAGPGVLPTADTGYGRLSSLICYDADFPDLARQGGRDGVDIMLISANTWAGIKRLHAENAIFRAVENGYTIVRQASRGQSNIVDRQGHTLALDDYFDADRQAVVASVPVSGVRTVYGTVGDLFAWLAVALALGLPVLAVVWRRRAGRGRHAVETGSAALAPR